VKRKEIENIVEQGAMAASATPSMVCKTLVSHIRRKTRNATMDIRPENPNDIETIRRITKSAFASAVHSSQTEPQIIDALRQAGALTISLVATEEDEVLGHVAFSPVTIDGEDKGWYGLGPVSVRPDQQRQGIGERLVRDGLSRLQNMGAMGCVVLGDPGYYQRFGFRTDDRLVFADAPTEYFMRLVFTEPLPSGQVRYHDGFNAS
jgi:putative acetyltransferase